MVSGTGFYLPYWQRYDLLRKRQMDCLQQQGYVVSQKKKKKLIIYSPSCDSKPVLLSCFCRTQDWNVRDSKKDTKAP